MTGAPLGSLRVEALRVGYPGHDEPVLAAVDLDVRPGERVAVLGPNGSGKTTLVAALIGLITAQRGQIRVDDIVVETSNLVAIRRAVGVVFQSADDQLFSSTVADDVAFGPANLGLRDADLAAAVDSALGAVDAANLASRHPYHLSGGEKRRAALATVLAMEPSILALDEPTAGLDPVGKRELAELLSGLAATQLIVTHDLPFALACCDRAVVLSGGRIAMDGPTAEVLSDAEALALHRLELPFGYPTPISDRG